MTERIAILGAGGIGSTIGAYLARAGHDVTLIDQWAAHIGAIRANGLTLIDANQRFTQPVQALHLSDLSSSRRQFDLAFVSVKSYDLVWHAHLLMPHLAPGACALPAMNALNDEPLARILGFERVMGCVTTISAGVYEPGTVVRTDPPEMGAFHIGELHGLMTARARHVAEMLNAVGPSEATTNLWGFRWSKLIWNSMGNAMAGLLGPNAAGMSAELKVQSDLIRVATGREAARVALAQGIAVEPVMILAAEELAACESRAQAEQQMAILNKYARQRALPPERVAQMGVPNRPSLLQDVIKGRRTEVDALNGAIVRHGAVLGIATPMNAALIETLHAIEAGEIQPGPYVLARLTPILPW